MFYDYDGPLVEFKRNYFLSVRGMVYEKELATPIVLNKSFNDPSVYRMIRQLQDTRYHLVDSINFF